MTNFGQRTRSGEAISGFGKRVVLNAYGAATGGTTLGSPPAGYTVLAFTGDGTLTVTKAGLFDVMVFGGGAGGGSAGPNNVCGGGGGAGGQVQATVYLDANQSIVVGAGGASVYASTSLGGTSKVGVVAYGVGGGRGLDVSGQGPLNGGCGGGGGTNTSAFGVGQQNNNGGARVHAGATTSGGGGGVGAVGADSVSATVGGAGGAGIEVNTFIGGSSLFKGGGGGGAGSVTGGAGGSSIGGAGFSGATGVGGSAAANTASGGGGSIDNVTASRAGGGGGSGIVYIRFKV